MDFSPNLHVILNNLQHALLVPVRGESYKLVLEILWGYFYKQF